MTADVPEGLELDLVDDHPLVDDPELHICTGCGAKATVVAEGLCDFCQPD